jgi:hypothetical protein
MMREVAICSVDGSVSPSSAKRSVPSCATETRCYPASARGDESVQIRFGDGAIRIATGRVDCTTIDPDLRRGTTAASHPGQRGTGQTDDRSTEARHLFRFRSERFQRRKLTRPRELVGHG